MSEELMAKISLNEMGARYCAKRKDQHLEPNLLHLVNSLLKTRLTDICGVEEYRILGRVWSE